MVLAVPVAAAFYLADFHSLRAQEEHAAELAAEVLRRAHRVSGQIDNAVKILTEAASPEPCSDASLRLMSRTSAENPYLVTTGYVHQDRLMCS
ncbi:MAG: CSS-motif domain-containing protein, partial [Rhodoferax sp.]